MNEQDIEKLRSISNSLQRLNSKVKLLALLEKAKKEFDSHNYSDCERYCNEILKKDSKNPIALRGLGCVMLVSGNSKKALEYYHLALDTSENKEIEYTLIGTVHYHNENLEEAIKYYNLAIDTNNDYENAYVGKNQAMLEYHLKIIDLQDSLIKQKLF